MLSSVVVCISLGCVLLAVGLIFGMLWDILMDLCSIRAHTERTYDILLKWATYYVVSEHQKGNNEPFDHIFPNDREKIEEQIKQDKCHIDNEYDILLRWATYYRDINKTKDGRL